MLRVSTVCQTDEVVVVALQYTHSLAYSSEMIIIELLVSSNILSGLYLMKKKKSVN